MTYFGFLAIFLGIPMAILSVITIVDYQRGKWMPSALSAWKPWTVIIALCVVAFVYTTPWDNYLVATNVWWYDIDLVSGIIFGYVPIEEYTFFILQPIMTSLWVLFLMRYLPHRPERANSTKQRVWGTIITAILWAISTVMLILTFVDAQYKPFTYLGLELSWALIPVLIQVVFGTDILVRHWRVVLLGIAVPTLYLSFADALAISSGTWTIDPEQSLNIYLGGVLPIEEFIFFLITNTLVVLGLTLVLAEESQPRAEALERIAVLRPIIQRMKHQPHTQTSAHDYS
jgi:lycopene cyclase domain-containing protein